MVLPRNLLKKTKVIHETYTRIYCSVHDCQRLLEHIATNMCKANKRVIKEPVSLRGLPQLQKRDWMEGLECDSLTLTRNCVREESERENQIKFCCMHQLFMCYLTLLKSA